MRVPRWTKLRHRTYWFRLAVPLDLRPRYGRSYIEETLRTHDPNTAEHAALERAAHWKRQFALDRGSAGPTKQTPQVVYERTMQKIAWIRREYAGHHDEDDIDKQDMEIQVLWDAALEPHMRRLGYATEHEFQTGDLPPEAEAVIAAIKAEREGRKEVPAAFREPFSVTAKAHLADRQREASRRVKNQTFAQKETVFRLFAEHIKDAPLSTIDRRMVTAFLDKLKPLSPAWGRSAAVRGLPLDQIIRRFSVKGGVEGLSTKTLSRYTSALSVLWEWAERRGEVTGSNPFARHLDGAKRPSDKNRPWSEEAIRAYFQANPDKSREGRPDPLYWLPRIALLSGMRISEICALERHDVQEYEGVTYFDISEAKTDAGVRVVPVHDELLPFLQIAPTAGYLFPELTPGGKDGKRSWAVGKRLGRRIRAIPGASTFHGLRKNVVETFERAHVPESETAQIVGHGKKGITYGVYSPNGLRIEQKRELIDLLGVPSA